MEAHEASIIGTVRHALALEPKLDATKIRIAMVGPELMLTGVVDDAGQVERAERIVRQVAPGVPIDNGLTVANGRGAWQDSDLGPRVTAAVQTSRDRLPGGPANVGVEVREGVAYLIGQCTTLADRKALVEAAGAVSGVKRVDADRLIVAPADGLDAARMASAARERLQQGAPSLANQVAIAVHERSARLWGRVRHEADRALAVELVSQVPGLQQVHDELQVYQDGDRADTADAAVEQAVRRALGEAGLPMPTIAVFSVRGVVSLIGSVGDPDWKRVALRVAAAVPGVVKVNDELKVGAIST